MAGDAGSILSILTGVQFCRKGSNGFSTAPSLGLFCALLCVILATYSKGCLFALVVYTTIATELTFFSTGTVHRVLEKATNTILFSVLVLLPSMFVKAPRALVGVASEMCMSMALINVLSSKAS